MSEVTLWLSVRATEWGASELFTRIIDADFAPRTGDSIMLLRTEEEPEGSASHEVKSHYWNFDGAYNVELRPFVLDTELTREYVRYWSAWWTDRDGDLKQLLLESGWKKYGA